MYDFKRHFGFHVELTDKCNARCPQCARNCIIGGKLQSRPDLVDTELSISDFKKIFDGFEYPIKNFSFCGNFGDPIFAKDIWEITEYTCSILDQNLYNRAIYMHTNGGFRPEKWWREYAKMFKEKCPNHLLVFSLDGLEDTHHFYRVNTRYDIVLRNARAFIDAGGNAEWSFIRFGHNEHQEEEARRRAKEYGFKTFIPVDTQRFWIRDNTDFEFNGEQYRITPATNMAAQAKKEQSKKWLRDKASITIKKAQKEIFCDVKKKNQLYIDCEGLVHPCCWIGSFEYRRKNWGQDVPDTHQPEIHQMFRMREQRNAITEDLTDIIEDDFYKYILPLSFDVSPCDTCARQCGKTTRVVSSKQREAINEGYEKKCL